MSKLRTRIEKLNERRRDPDTSSVVGLTAKFAGVGVGRAFDEALEFLLTATSPVPEDYTRKTIEAAERVQNHLEQQLPVAGVGVEFAYQGSVTNGTHIRVHSDVDILAVTTRFVTVVPPVPAVPAYLGNPVNDLLEIRLHASRILRAEFPTATVDDSGAKCIAVSGGSLKRRIEVVPANWVDTQDWRTTYDKVHRGIHVLDVRKSERIRNFPFLHNHRVDEKDRRVSALFRPLARLAKCIKCDAPSPIQISSYDLVGLCYALPDETYLRIGTAQTSELLLELAKFAMRLINDPAARAKIKVPNETRELFGSDGIKADELTKWVREAVAVLEDLSPSPTTAQHLYG